MQQATHAAISPTLVGEPLVLDEGAAIARLLTTREMAADERRLVHGGFVFGLADYAAMLAVNHPYVVLGAADTRFVAPVRVGDEVLAEARVTEEDSRKRVIEVRCRVGDRTVLTGTFTAFVLDQHVLAGLD